MSDDKKPWALGQLLGIPKRKVEWVVEGAAFPPHLEEKLNGLPERGLTLYSVIPADMAAWVIAYRVAEDE
jgi:hypothetical protein